MTGYQDVLDDEVGTPPPSTVDVDAVIARQRRRVRYQRAGAVVSVGAMTAAAALGVAALLPRPGAPAQVGATGRPTGPSASASSTGSAPGSARKQEAARLTGELQQIMTRTLPTARFVPTSVGGSPPTAALEFADKGDHFAAAAAVNDSSGTGGLYVSVGKEDTEFRHDRACSQVPPPADVRIDCAVRPGPDGAIVMVLSATMGSFKRYLVEIIRPDGNSVSVEVSNGAGDPYVAQRPTPPLSQEQTVTLAEEPALATTG
jgi:hypothetical protein